MLSVAAVAAATEEEAGAATDDDWLGEDVLVVGAAVVLAVPVEFKLLGLQVVEGGAFLELLSADEVG